MDFIEPFNKTQFKISLRSCNADVNSDRRVHVAVAPQQRGSWIKNFQDDGVDDDVDGGVDDGVHDDVHDGVDDDVDDDVHDGVDDDVDDGVHDDLKKRHNTDLFVTCYSSSLRAHTLSVILACSYLVRHPRMPKSRIHVAVAPQQSGSWIKNFQDDGVDDDVDDGVDVLLLPGFLEQLFEGKVF